MKYSNLAALLAVSGANAMTLNPDSKESICFDTALIQQGMLDYYEGTRYGGTVGMFQPPYYWWEAGEAFGAMLQNWFLCDNDTFVPLIQDAIVHQAGPQWDFMPENQTMVEGNDDQGVWAMTLMEAVERGFPEVEGAASYLTMAENTFKTMWDRWNDSNCNGGLRWQIYPWNNGYDYKNTISNICLFTFAARLGRYTGDESYFNVAQTVWDWLIGTGLIVDENNNIHIFDGASVNDNCTSITKLEWTYNYGLLIAGCAYLYSATNEEVWLDRLNSYLTAATVYFFQDGVMYEAACQPYDTCNNDQRAFKGLFAQMLGLTSVLVPSTADTINPLIRASALAAARTCDGGYSGHTCSMNWLLDTTDGVYGLGEQIDALDVMQALLIHSKPLPYSEAGGRIRMSSSSSASSSSSVESSSTASVIQHEGSAAALTTGFLSTIVGAIAWMLF